MSNLGAQKLTAANLPLEKVTQHCGVSTQTVYAWRNGRRLPGDVARKLLCGIVEGLKETDFDRPPEVVAAEPIDLGSLEVATAEKAVREADLLLAHIKRLRLRLLADNVDSVTQLGHIESLTKLVLDLGKLTGAGIKLSLRQILASPDWKVLEDCILDALVDYPEAMRSVAAALEKAKL